MEVGCIISHLDDMAEEYGSIENYLKHLRNADKEIERNKEIKRRAIAAVHPAAYPSLRAGDKRKPE